MKQEAIAKAATTKKMNQLAGARPTLPGHGHGREESLRAELTASFQPVGAAEMLWVNDIAYCSANIEVIKAQMAGMRMRLLEQAHAHLQAIERLEQTGAIETGADLSQDDRNWLALFVERKFVAPWHHTFLDNPLFASLLARVGKEDIDRLRLLQQMLHDEAKERDRIINQFDRRRRNAMRDAIEQAEEARRAEIFRRLSADESGNGATIEPALLKLIPPGSSQATGDDAADTQVIDNEQVDPSILSRRDIPE